MAKHGRHRSTCETYTERMQFLVEYAHGLVRLSMENMRVHGHTDAFDHGAKVGLRNGRVVDVYRRAGVRMLERFVAEHRARSIERVDHSTLFHRHRRRQRCARWFGIWMQRLSVRCTGRLTGIYLCGEEQRLVQAHAGAVPCSPWRENPYPRQVWTLWADLFESERVDQEGGWSSATNV